MAADLMTDRYRTALEPYRDRAVNAHFSLANHLPMALGALAALGAPDERLAAFARAYVARMELGPMDDAERAGRAEAAAIPIAAALAPLWSSAGTTAFHALIRTAYGLERDDADEIAAGLAAWRRYTLDLGVTPAADAPRVPLPDALTRLAPVFDAVTVPRSGMITSRMQLVAADPSFAAALAASPRAADLPELTLLAAAAFGATRNFVALHAMTSAHALGVLLPYAADADAAVAAYWPAFAAAFVVAGAPAVPDAEELDGIRAAAPPSWDAILAATLASDDDHVVKAVYTAWRCEQRSGDRVFRWAAQRYALG